jgi:hypothetical protein
MIEYIRKYTGLMIVVLVVVFISFLFVDSRSLQRMGGATSVLKIDGKNYTDAEFRRMGTASFELTQGLAQTGDFGLYQFLLGLSGGAMSQEDAIQKFFVGRILLREAQADFGIFPSEDDISDTIRKMRAFTGPDGSFNSEAYRGFLKNGLGRMSLGESDLRELVSDYLVSQKLNAILGTGLGVNRNAVAETLALENQQITAELGRLDLAPFEDKIEPTEEEIKSYWETIRDNFTTEPRRKFTYVIASPAAVVETPEEEAAPTLAEAAAGPEAEKAQLKAAEEKKAARAAKLAEDRRKNQLELDAKVDDFLYELENQKGGGFEELAKANGWEVKTTELFPVSTPPADLAVSLRASSTGGTAIEQLFRIEASADPSSKISPALPVGENQWLVARLDAEEKSRTQTYEEARAEARAQYISEKAEEALKAAADAAVVKIKESLAAGKSFADAAKEAGINEVTTSQNITSSSRPDGATEPQNLFEITRNVDPGALAEVVTESDRAFIIHVAKREVVKEPNAAARLDSEVTSQTTTNETIAFLSWLNARTEAANVQKLQP